MTASDSGISRRLPQSPHLMRGFSQTPGRHSLAQAGLYPDLPVVLLSHRIVLISVRPRNRSRNSATLPPVDSLDDSDVSANDAGGRHSIPRASSSEISLAFSACSLASNC